MLKKTVLLFLLFAAAALFADVVPIGDTRNGYPVIIPQVKTLKPARGAFVLPEQLTVAAPAEFDLSTLAREYAKAVEGGRVLRAEDGQTAALRFELTTEGVPDSPEGYTLDITPGGVIVRARDVRGLFYGMQTFNWFLRGRKVEGRGVKCCRIADWPDLEIRGLYYQLAYVDPRRVDRVCHVIDVLGSLKYNALLIGFFDNFPYVDSPFTKRKRTFSKEDIAKIKAAAKRNHIEIIPKLQVISHAGWIHSHRDWTGENCEFYEGPYKKPSAALYCPASPEAQKLVMKMVRETVEEFKPRYFHLGLDEILLAGYPICPKCRAADPTQTIINHVRPIKDMLTSMGVQTIIYHDEYFGSSNPIAPKQVSTEFVPEGLGRDVMINSWEYEASPSRRIGDRIRKRGFKDLVYMSFAIDADNCWKLPKVAHETKSKGNFLAYWSIVPPTLDGPHEKRAHEFYPSTIAQANYTWNATDVEFSRIPIDSANIMCELLDGKPKNRFRGEATPVPMGGVCNARIDDDPLFPHLDARLVAKIQKIAAADRAKFKLAVKDGSLYAVVLSGTPMDGRPAGSVRIPVGSEASGASFLVTASAFNNYGLVDKQRGFPIGEIEIVYDDGKVVKQPLIFQRNVNDWNTYLGGNGCRPVLRGNDLDGALFSFYAIDWRNPRPEQPIREIVFSSKGDTQIAPALLAISLSDIGKTVPAGAPGAPKRHSGIRVEAPELVTIADFSKGMPKGWSSVKTAVPKCKIRTVNDPERGRVLEIRIPTTTKHLARVVVDLPLNNPQEFKNIVFDIKVSDSSSIFRSDCYVMNRQATQVLGALGYVSGLRDSWQTVCIPRERFLPKEGGGIDPAKANRIRIGFFLKNDIKPTVIRIGNISFCDHVLPGRVTNTAPAK